MLHKEDSFMTTFSKLQKNLLAGALLLTGSTTVHTLSRDPFFEPFGTLFEELGGAFTPPTKSHDASEKDLKARVKTLQEESKKLAAAADVLAAELEKKEAERSIDPAVSKVTDTYAAVDEAVRGIKRESTSMKRARVTEERAKVPAFKLRSSVDDKDGSFVVTATLPGVEKDALRITVSSEDEFGRERQTLHIKTQQKDAKSPATGSFSSSSMSSSRYINGRREELNVNDGAVEITVDLPQDVSTDLEAVQKNMRFEAGELILSFPCKGERRKRETELRFDSAEGPSTRKIKLK
jgi:HSP20 family molecular chaperone IbpA